MGSKQSQNPRRVKRVSLFGLPLDLCVNTAFVLERIHRGNFILTYLNPYSYSIATKNHRYADNLQRFDCVVCDGIGIQTAAKTVFDVTPPILTPDYSGIARGYLESTSAQGVSLCLVGAQREVVQQATAIIRDEYPGFRRVIGFDGFNDSPGLAKEAICKEEFELVLAGMGMGRQESFLLDLRDSGWRGVGLCVGGFFDKLANPRLEYQLWAEKARLRFLGRLVREPRRLSRRYFIDYQRFIGLYLKYLFRGK